MWQPDFPQIKVSGKDPRAFCCVCLVTVGPYFLGEACSTFELSVKSSVDELATLITVILSATAGSLGIGAAAQKLLDRIWAGEF